MTTNPLTGTHQQSPPAYTLCNPYAATPCYYTGLSRRGNITSWSKVIAGEVWVGGIYRRMGDEV